MYNCQRLKHVKLLEVYNNTSFTKYLLPYRKKAIFVLFLGSEFCVWSLFCNAVLRVRSNFAIICTLVNVYVDLVVFTRIAGTS